jgi:hypothetical protein
VRIVATPTLAAAPIPGGNTVGMLADVSAAESDPATGNNSFQGWFSVRRAQADVGVTVGASPDPVNVGQQVTITATVSNAGPDAATNVTLSLPMVAVTRDFVGISVTPSQGTCDPVVAGNPITCSLGTMAPGASATVRIVATPTLAAAPIPGGNTVGMLADVSAAESDPATGNNHFDNWFGVQRVGTPTPVGQDVTVQPTDLTGTPQPFTVMFSEVTVAGVTYAVPVVGPPPLPGDFQIKGIVYDITTTAQFTPPVTVCFQGSFTASDWIMHFENGLWVKLPNRQLLPASADPFATICGDTNTLSPFAVATELNQAPVLNSIGNREINEGQLLEITITATDPDGDVLTYSANNLPAGATFNTVTGTFSWIPDYTQAGNFSVVFTATDNGTPPISASEIITITVGNVNRPPIFYPIGNKQGYENQLLQFTITASDPDGDALIYTANNLPIGAIFDPSSQTFNWITNYDQNGNYVVSFTLTDNGSPPLSTSEAITITVGNVNRPPVLNPIGNVSAIEGILLEFTITATDPDGDGLTYTANNLPSGAIFNPATQQFRWTPGYDQSGNHTIEFSVMDNGSPIEVDSEVITITVGNVNRAPVFTFVGTQQVIENQLLQFYVIATDYDGDGVTYSTNALPNGASFDPVNRLFSWRPDSTQVGTYTVAFYAVDNGLPPMTGQLGVVISIGNVYTPCGLASQIIQSVLSLNLSRSVENSYMANLKKVCRFVEEGKTTPAINQLEAFINKVRTDITKGNISEVAGNNLINMAINLINIIKS